ncbi:MEDS domain-containing protein [Umezawaea sp. Da 62-37]|uniref:MEDS domain-containing protein n=1 Tax=Umezawaea sp. Da 62-37 TaxID=3075927 RepID=UPI0028F70E45|nr:MEDS domain-containing protein [Umezawaea sp. Da 62-37]WNV85591.1 MEDS domain-containing protein [Umezawaea sp. Da 62-37]
MSTREAAVTTTGVRERQVGDVGLGGHACLSFADDAEQRRVVTEYLSAGVADGHRVLHFADRQAPATVLGWLEAAGVDTGSAVARGQLSVVTADESYLASGRFSSSAMVDALRREVDAGVAAGFGGLRVCGEMSWALRGIPGAEELDEYERAVDAVFREGRASAICQYDARLFPPDRLDALDRCHRLSVEQPPLHSSALLRLVPAVRSGRHCLRVIGMVDNRTLRHFTAALGTARDWPGDIVVDMSALRFIDVAGLRDLADTAAHLGGGRRLRIEHLAPALCHVVRLVGWDRAPGLTLVADGATT